MTNKERVIKAINFEKTDYLPYDVSFTGQQYEKMVKAYGQDYLSSINNHMTMWGLSSAHNVSTDEYEIDEYGVVWGKEGEDKDIGVPRDFHITSEEDFRRYKFPEVETEYIKDACEKLMKTDENNFRMMGIGFSMYERLWSLMGIEDALANMIVEPELVHKILNTICERTLAILDIALAYDYDGFYFGDDWGQQQGTIMGPALWREFIKPYVSRLYDRVRSSGKYVIQHSCGDIRDIMDDLYEMGLNVYQTFQPEIYGLDYSKKMHGKIAIWGGISTQNDLPSKTPEEIKQITRATVNHFKDTGGIIVAPTHSVPHDVPVENIKAMVEVFMSQ